MQFCDMLKDGDGDPQQRMIKSKGDSIPSMYVDSNLLARSIINSGHTKRGTTLELTSEAKGATTLDSSGGKVYEISGEFFEELEEGSEEEYVWFEMETDSEMDVYSDISDSTPLVALTIHEVHGGVIVNSEVFLTEQQWHTLVRTGEELYCAVCNDLCPLDGYTVHTSSKGHARNLEAHLPLDLYDLSIIRKIGGMYHCGVCNELFDGGELEEHLESKSHEEQMLTAMNKVSDIMYEGEQFDGQSPKGLLEFDLDGGDPEEDDFGGFYDDLTTCSRRMDYPPAHCSDSDGADEGATYASIAGSPSRAPKYIEVELGTRKAWVQPDTWHMLLAPRPNRFYCMVCRAEGHKRRKLDHCSEDRHLSNLMKCTVVKKYKRHLVRRIDHRLLHCAHCNNLQLVSDMDDHLEARHPIVKNKNMTEPHGNSAAVQDKATLSNGQKKIPKPRPQPNPPDRDECIITKIIDLKIFSHRVTLSLLSYNTVLVYDGYYCCVCQFRSNADSISRHLKETNHMERLKGSQFLVEFSCNMIRTVPGNLHCALCNVLVADGYIRSHINDPYHVSIMKDAIVPQPVAKSKMAAKKHPCNQFSILTELADSNSPGVTEKIAPEAPSDNISGGLGGGKVPDEEVPQFDVEEFVHLKLGNLVMKVSACSYNTLVSLGDGGRQCFLCSEHVPLDNLAVHVSRREHQENIQNNKFLEKHERSLLRQVYVTFHCGVCNVLLPRRDLNAHLAWPVHLQHVERASGIKKKARRGKGPVHHEIALQKEAMYFSAAEPQIKVGQALKLSPQGVVGARRLDKLVIINGDATKVEWRAWHGIREGESGAWCRLCEKHLMSEELTAHTNNPSHVESAHRFLVQHFPALIRTVNERTVNCVICNVDFEVSSVPEHIGCRSHVESHKAFRDLSSKVEYFTDCSDKILVVEGGKEDRNKLRA